MTIELLTHLNWNALSSSLKVKLSQVKHLIEKNSYSSHLFAIKQRKKIIALALSWQNSFHPHADYLGVFVGDHLLNPTLTRIRLLEKLEAELSATASSTDRFIYPLNSYELETKQTLEALQYELIRKTYEPSLSLDHVLANYSDVNESSHFLTLKEILADTGLSSSLFALFKAHYERTHLVNPAKRISREKWQETLLEYPLDLQNSLVSVSEGAISSFILLLQANGATQEVGWTGETGHPDSSGIQSLFKTQLLKLKKAGIQTLEPEIDTTSPTDYNQLFSFLPFQSMDSWDTYRKFKSS